MSPSAASTYAETAAQPAPLSQPPPRKGSTTEGSREPRSSTTINQNRYSNTVDRCGRMADSLDQMGTRFMERYDPIRRRCPPFFIVGMVLMAFAAALVLALGWRAAFQAIPQPITLKEASSGDYLKLLLGLFFVTLIVERSIEVLLNLFWDPLSIGVKDNFEKHERAVSFKADQIKHYEADLANARKDKTATAKIEENLRQAEDEMSLTLIEHDFGYWANRRNVTHKRISTSTASFIAGLVVSALGLRILETLIAPGVLENRSPRFLSCFRLVDILLAAGLIAGGSDGIHRIISSLMALADKLKGGNALRALGGQKEPQPLKSQPAAAKKKPADAAAED
jgi:hypothetical protein